MNKQVQKQITYYAKKGADKICGVGQCVACFNCGHSNKAHTFLPRFDITKDATCPLAKYEVVPHEINKEYKEPSDKELVCLCLNCDNTSEHDIAINIHLCYNCPVYITREAIEENRAEARWS